MGYRNRRNPVFTANLMPSERAHRATALESEAVCLSLAASSPTWSVIVAFYAALHYVDTFLAREFGVHPESHRARSEFVVRAADLRAIHGHFLALLEHSQFAPYRGRRYSESQAMTLIRGEFTPVKQHIASLIGS